MPVKEFLDLLQRFPIGWLSLFVPTSVAAGGTAPHADFTEMDVIFFRMGAKKADCRRPGGTINCRQDAGATFSNYHFAVLWNRDHFL